MKTLALVITILFCLNVHAEISVGVENASSVIYLPEVKSTSIYYSNINQLDKTGGNYVGDPKGLTCNTSLNPNCKNKNSFLILNISSERPVIGSASYYLVYVPPGSSAPAPGALISSIGRTFFTVPYSAAKNISPMVLPYIYICTRLVEAGGTGIDSDCNQSDPSYPAIFSFYLIADANGNGVLDAGEEVAPISLSFDSSIPRYGSKKNELGLYGFEAFALDRSVAMVNLRGGIGMFGAKAVRFYYATGPLAGSYDPKFFQGLDPALTPQPLNFFESGIEADGTILNDRFGPLQNGQRYYFRSAIVDAAGNIGYLTPPEDDGMEHTANPTAR